MTRRRWVAGVFVFFAGLTTGVAAAQQRPPEKAAPPSAQAPQLSPLDRRSEAYYEFAMGRLYESFYDSTSQSEYATRAIEHYKRAHQLDPRADVISERLAEIYAKSQRLRDAVLEAQEIIRRDPDNLPARRLLGRIYRRTLGDLSPGNAQRETLVRAIEQYREILRIDPGDTEAGLWLARLYRLNNEHEKAGEVLRGLLANEPENETLLEQFAQLLLDGGNTREVVEQIAPLAARAQNPKLLGLLGDAYFQSRDYARAEDAYRRAAEAAPRDAEFVRGLAQALLFQDKHEEALEQLRRLTALDPDNPEHFLRLAQTYRQLGKLEQAEENLLRAREMAPGSVEVIYNEALLYEAQGRYQDAIRVLSDAISSVKSRSDRLRNPQRTLGVLYEQLGRLYREVENFQAAIFTFQELQRLGSEEEKRAQMLIVDTYRVARQMDQAVAESQRLLEQNPGDSGWRAAHALLLGEKGDTDEAVRLLREEIGRRGGDSRELYLSLAQVLERGRRFAEAEEAAARAAELSSLPAETESVELVRAGIYERQKKHELAERHFDKVLELNPHNAIALNNYGYMLVERGVRLEEAAAMLERAVGFERNNGAYLDSLGWAYFKLNRFEEAEKYLRRAAERLSRSPTIREHLGDLYFRTGRMPQAAAEWERALAEWRRALPTEFEHERVAALEKKLEQVKRSLAQTAAPAPKPE